MIDWMKRHPPPLWLVMFLWGLVFGLHAPAFWAWLRELA